MKPYYDQDGITIYHGDCREIDVWAGADVMLTDPPYGMDFVSSWTKQRRPVAGDKDPALRDEALRVWGDRPAAVFGTWRVPRPPATRQVLTWFKSSVGPGMGDLSLPWGTATEEIYILGDGWRGKRRPNLITTAEQRGGSAGIAALLGHPTPKPTELMAQILTCAPDGVVCDPFGGVGATALACVEADRRCIVVELEEKYCETMARRLAQGVLPFGAQK